MPVVRSSSSALRTRAAFRHRWPESYYDWIPCSIRPMTTRMNKGSVPSSPTLFYLAAENHGSHKRTYIYVFFFETIVENYSLYNHVTQSPTNIFKWGYGFLNRCASIHGAHSSLHLLLQEVQPKWICILFQGTPLVNFTVLGDSGPKSPCFLGYLF